MAQLKLIHGLPFLSICAVAFTVWGISTANRTDSDVVLQAPESGAESFSASAAVSAFADHVAAVGIVEPSSEEIRVGTSKAGTVEEVLVTTGARVKKGDVLFVIDSRLAKAEVERWRSELVVAEAKVAQTRAMLIGLQAEVDAASRAFEAAEVENEDAVDLVRIGRGLTEGDTITAREMTRRKNAQRKTTAHLGAAAARLTQAKANLALYDSTRGGQSLAVEVAAVARARAFLAEAQTNLDLLIVRAPTDGTILQVNLRPGEFAQSDASPLPLIVMGQIEQLNVRVDIDELDIPRWAAAAKATAMFRASFAGSLRLTFVRKEPMIVPKRNLSGRSDERVDTRVMQVIYAIESAGMPLLPGQQLDVLIEASKPGIQLSERQ
jgi:multidrug efflux pump subunit AcrA (membrane-fusion protein)